MLRIQQRPPHKIAAAYEQTPMLHILPQEQGDGGMMKRIGVIGYGAIGSWIAQQLANGAVPGMELVALCVRERQRSFAGELLPDTTNICTNIQDFLSYGLDLVIEAAGQGTLADCGVRILDHGCELQILSTGALADRELRDALKRGATRNGVQVTVPAGALAGFRGLMTLRQAGLTSVKYTSIKPPHAWSRTPAAEQFDLDGLDEPCVVFHGNAAEAARQFPANANLAAAVALAGIGFQDTIVTLVADPGTTLNIGHLEADSPVATLDLKVSGSPCPDNPKTSQITAMSVIAALQNSNNAITFI